jgi:hypothetical protein
LDFHLFYLDFLWCLVKEGMVTLSFIKSYGRSVVLALVVVGLVATLSAAGDNNGNPAILQAVQALQSTIDSLVTAVSSLTTTVDNINTATTPGNTLFTPPLLVFQPDAFTCNVTNVSSAQRNVTVQVINNSAVVARNITVILEPGNSTSLGASSNFLGFCKITVNNGVKTDVRGVLAMFGDGQGDRNPVAAQ